MRFFALITTVFFSIFICAGTLEAGTVGTIQLTSNPSAIVADGKSFCTITAMIKDKNGNLVSNDTVHFTTSLGVIDESQPISGGVARASLVSSNIKGTAIVTATCLDQQAVAQINVVFGDKTVIATGPRYVSVKADKYLAYSLDHKVLEAIGHVTIRYRSLEMECAHAQVDLVANKIVAGGDATQLVKIKTSKGDITGNLFFCNMGSRGVLLSTSSGQAQQIDISSGAPNLVGKAVGYMHQDFDFKDLGDSTGLIKAKTATIFLNEKIQFTDASLYLDGKRRFSLPLYVLSLNGYMVDGKPYLDVTTNGIEVNLPYYYSLTPSSSGAFLVTHASTPGWGSYGQTPGWGLDMREQYKTDTAQGMFEFSQIGSYDWGLAFQHSQQLDPVTQTYLYLDYPDHQDIFGNFSINRSFKQFDLGLNLSGDKLTDGGGESVATNLVAQTKPKTIGKSIFKWTVSGTMAYTDTIVPTVAAPVVINTGSPTTPTVPTVVPVAAQQGFTPSFMGNVFTSPYNITKNLSLTGSASLGYLWGSGSDMSGMSTLGTSALTWKMSPKMSFMLGYRYADLPSVYTTDVGEQTATATWRYDGTRWQASLYAIKGLDYSSLNFFGDFVFKINPLWQFGLRSTLNEFAGLSYRDLEVSVGRKFGAREVTMLWSESQHRILFDLGGAAF